MDFDKVMQCNYFHQDLSRCQRTAKKEYCVFHTPLEHEKRVSDRRFIAMCRKIITNGETDLRGFIFPSVFVVNGFQTSEKIDISGAKFQDLNVTKSKMESELVCNRIIVIKRLSLNSSTISRLDCSNSEFQDVVEISSVSILGDFSANNCRFNGRFELSGSIEGNASFYGSLFSGRCIFSMQRSVSLSVTSGMVLHSASSLAVLTHSTNQKNFKELLNQLKRLATSLYLKYKKAENAVINYVKSNYAGFKKIIHLQYKSFRSRFPYEQEGVDERRLFLGSSNLNNVVFEKPKLVLFRSVDLRRCSFEGTDMRGVNFLDCDWFQTKLGRNGLESEHSLDSPDYHARRLFLPRVESVCRNIRQSMEENKDYLLSNDFFIGEMEAKRKQQGFFKKNFFSIIAWYNATSRYGTSPIIAFRFIMYTAFIHSLVIYYHLGGNNILQGQADNINQFKSFMDYLLLALDDFFDVLIYSFQTMTLQREKVLDLQKIYNDMPTSIYFVNFMASILGPFLTVIFGLSIRTKIKRS